MKNIIGKPVDGANFFGRDRELRELRRICEDEHILLLAPRRVGKTSLLHALALEVSRDASAVGAYVSVAAAKNEPQFVEAVLRSIYETKAGKKLKPNPIATWIQRHGRRVRGIKVAGTGVDVDGYLVEQAGRWRFRSGLLRRYWERHVP
jgi:ATP/maltotriose-dependent transcriptional regulator MalT